MITKTLFACQKPMSISSITSPPSIHSSALSQQADQYHDHHQNSLVSTSRLTVDCQPQYIQGNDSTRIFDSSSPPSFHSSNRSSGDENGITATGTLSLQERRIRNKTASAKYRAKRNQQYHEMRSMIISLTKENDVLIRQFEQLKSENRSLKLKCDKVRSKVMANRMLKQMLDDHEQKDKYKSLPHGSENRDDVLVHESDRSEDDPDDTTLPHGLYA